MATVETTACSSWEDLRRSLFEVLFRGNRFQAGRYLFRGTGCEAWSLTSSFDRFADAVALGDREGLANRLLELFVRQCESNEDLSGCPDDHEARVALAQHYGLPTRALDWTESPYIAAYFAFSDVFGSKVYESANVAVWALDREHAAWNGSMGARVVVGGGSYRNPRLLRQRGHFTYLHAPVASLEGYVAACPDDGAALYKFTCLREDAPSALADLTAMGITATSLFPDYGGAARAALSEYELSKAEAPAGS